MLTHLVPGQRGVTVQISVYFSIIFSVSRVLRGYFGAVCKVAPHCTLNLHNALFEVLLVSARPANRELFPCAKPEPEPELLSITEKHMLRTAKH